MADSSGNKPPQMPARESELLPAIMAIALAVVAQLALQDGIILLGVIGYVVAVWLFLLSVRGRAEGWQAAVKTTAPDAESPAIPNGGLPAGGSRLAYLRRHWRLLTLAEIFQGDIPPARLQGQEPSAPPEAQPDAKAEAAAIQATTEEDAPATHKARLEKWAAADSPAASPRAVKVTAQGDVLVLDVGLEQVQRFDTTGKLLATYPLAGLAGLEIVDLAVSPDGGTLYVVDAASKRLQVITLSDEAAGEEE